MSIVKVKLSVELDNAPLDGFPLERRVEVQEAVELANLQRAPDNNATTFGSYGTEVPIANVIVLRADQAVNVKLNNLLAMALNAGGLIIIIDGNLTAVPQLAINNPALTGGVTVNLKGVVAGT